MSGRAAPRHGAHTKKASPAALRAAGEAGAGTTRKKGGGCLLSRIALQYHRRKWA